MCDAYRNAAGPNAVSQPIVQAITSCWHILPKDSRSVEKLETEIRRIVDRALKDVKQDAEAFGFTSEPPAE